MPGDPLVLLLILAGEILSGAVLGTAALIMFSAVQVAGTVISFVSAMANALVFDPVSQQQSAIVAGFLTTAATLLLFVTDLHHVLIQALIDSYSLFKPGAPHIMGDISELSSARSRPLSNLVSNWPRPSSSYRLYITWPSA